jgi:hypothetical protein
MGSQLPSMQTDLPSPLADPSGTFWPLVESVQSLAPLETHFPLVQTKGPHLLPSGIGLPSAKHGAPSPAWTALAFEP